MKATKTLGLATAGVVWLATVATAQRVTTNPNAVPNTVSTPTFSPDTLRPSRDQLLNDDTAGQDDADRKTGATRNDPSDEANATIKIVGMDATSILPRKQPTRKTVPIGKHRQAVEQ